MMSNKLSLTPRKTNQKRGAIPKAPLKGDASDYGQRPPLVKPWLIMNGVNLG